MRTSLIIPTLNRPKDIKRCLDSIVQLNRLFDEIIIVEQGDINNTKTTISAFSNLNISLYFHPIESGAQARNVGIEKASGDFLFFIDDDTALVEKNYIDIALNHFNDNPKVMGIDGLLLSNKAGYYDSKVVRFLHKFFFLNGNNFNINCAGINNNSWLDSEMQNAQWLFGGNMVCRNEVFKQGFRFNHHFIRHSDYEDAMLSYQIYQFYGHGSLVYLPSFKLMHFESDDDNNTNVQALKMRTLYQFVLWRQMIFVQSPLNLLCYCHAQVGVMLVELVHPRRTKHRWLKFKTFLKTYFYILKNHKKIATNSIDFNQFILND